MNKVVLYGRLTRDPEISNTKGAEPKCVARFSAAVPRDFKQDGQPDADFINCVAFGRTGELIDRFFHKGKEILLSGRLQTRSWDDAQTGQRRWATDVIVDKVTFVGKKDDNVAPAPPGEKSLADMAASVADDDDADLPF